MVYSRFSFSPLLCLSRLKGSGCRPFFFKTACPFNRPRDYLGARDRPIDRSIGGGILITIRHRSHRGGYSVFRAQREEIHPGTTVRRKRAFYRDYRFCIYPSKQGAVKRDSSNTCDCRIRGIGRWFLSLSSPFSFFHLLGGKLNDPRSGTRDLCVKPRIIAARFRTKVVSFDFRGSIPLAV